MSKLATIGRSVTEWIASSPDAEIPKRVKLRIWEREGGMCSLTGRKIMPGEAYDFEHVKPLSMGGEHRESNLRLALREAHRAKTADEAGARAKADRIRAKHIGAWPRSKRPPAIPGICPDKTPERRPRT